MNARRAEAFSDGVFAVAITLLIFDVQIPAVGAGRLAQAVVGEWPAYAAYAASFLTIGVMWLNHHRIFMLVERADRVLLMLNVLLLMGVAFLPYPTALLGRYLGSGENARAAAVAYSVTATLISLAFMGVWLYLATHAQQLGRGIERGRALAVAPRFGLGIAIYAASIAVAFFSPVVVLLVYAALAVYYTLEQLPTVGPETAQD